MKGPVRYSRGLIEYTGRIERAAFTAWTESSDGRSMAGRMAAESGFALFGKMRAARRRLWRELNETVQSTTSVRALQREVDRYRTYVEVLVYARDLPRVSVELRRLVVVPRVVANGAMSRRVDAALDAQPALASVNERASLRDWFGLTLIHATEAAIVAAQPSPKRPLPAGDSWAIVGVNERFDWRVPIVGPAWPGHYYVLELTRAPVTRAIRASIAAAIERLEASLPSLPRLQRQEILRQASSSLEEPAHA